MPKYDHVRSLLVREDTHCQLNFPIDILVAATHKNIYLHKDIDRCLEFEAVAKFVLHILVINQLHSHACISAYAWCMD
jgi:hypothetical protein